MPEEYENGPKVISSIDFSKIVRFYGNYFIANCTGHNLNFIINGELFVVEPCGATLPTEPVVKNKISGRKIEFTESKPEPTKTGEVELQEILFGMNKFFDDEEAGNTIIVGSRMSAEAYGPMVVYPITTNDNPRCKPSEKICDHERFGVVTKEKDSSTNPEN